MRCYLVSVLCGGLWAHMTSTCGPHRQMHTTAGHVVEQEQQASKQS